MMVNNKILEYNHNKVIVEENDDSYVIDFQRGLGEVSYSKKIGLLPEPCIINLFKTTKRK